MATMSSQPGSSGVENSRQPSVGPGPAMGGATRNMKSHSHVGIVAMTDSMRMVSGTPRQALRRQRPLGQGGTMTGETVTIAGDADVAALLGLEPLEQSTSCGSERVTELDALVGR